MTKYTSYQALGLSQSRDDQIQTRTLLGMLMDGLDIASFDLLATRNTFKEKMHAELTAPQTKFCGAVQAAYANNGEQCIQALYNIARLIRKARVDREKAHVHSSSNNPSAVITHISQLVPTFTLTTSPTITATLAPLALPPTTEEEFRLTSPTWNMPHSMFPNMNNTTTIQLVRQASAPENVKYWVSDSIIHYRDASSPFARTFDFRFSDLVHVLPRESAHVLDTTFVDADRLLFIRFAQELTQGFPGHPHDLCRREIWLRMEDPVWETSYEVTVARAEYGLHSLEAAFSEIINKAKENAYTDSILSDEEVEEALNYESMLKFLLSECDGEDR